MNFIYFFLIIIITIGSTLGSFDTNKAIADIATFKQKNKGATIYDYLKTLSVGTVEKTQSFVTEAQTKSTYRPSSLNFTQYHQQIESHWPVPHDTIHFVNTINFLLLKSADFKNGDATFTQRRTIFTAVFAAQRSIAANGILPSTQLYYPSTANADERINNYIIHLAIIRRIFDAYIQRLGLVQKTPDGTDIRAKVQNIYQLSQMIATKAVTDFKNDTLKPEWVKDRQDQHNDSDYKKYIDTELAPIIHAYIRTRGILLGSALGDAVGTPNEFSGGPMGSVHGFKRVHHNLADADAGMTSPVTEQRWDKYLVAGQFTDDTSMGLAGAQSLLDNGKFDPTKTLHAYHDWWFHGHYSAIGSGIGLGATISTSLNSYKTYLSRLGISSPHPPYDPYSKDFGTSTNGSLMRMAHTAVFEWDNLDAMMSLAEYQGRVTHQAPQAVQCTRLMAWLLHHVIHDIYPSKDTLLDAFSAHALNDTTLDPELRAMINSKTWKHKFSTLDEKVTFLNRIINGRFNRLEGSAIGAFEIALWAFYQTNTFADGTLEIANIGFDSDTHGAIYGMLAGAYYGLEGMNPIWVQKLQWHDGIQEFTSRLFFKGRSGKTMTSKG